MPAIRQLDAEAIHFCKDPESFGMTIKAHGAVQGIVTTSRLARIIASATGTVAADASVERYQGVTQSQLTQALADTNNCRVKALDSLRSLYVLLRRDQVGASSGRSTRGDTTKRNIAAVSGKPTTTHISEPRNDPPPPRHIGIIIEGYDNSSVHNNTVIGAGEGIRIEGTGKGTNETYDNQIQLTNNTAR